MNLNKDDVRAVLRAAKIMDARMPGNSETALEVWHRALSGGKVWPDEAVDSVYAHYAVKGAWPMTPGDVIAFCSDQPIWSSAAHAKEFLREWCQHPYSHKIEAETGIQEPVIDIPMSVPREGHKKYLQERLRVWVNSNEDRLVKAILDKRPA